MVKFYNYVKLKNKNAKLFIVAQDDVLSLAVGGYK